MSAARHEQPSPQGTVGPGRAGTGVVVVVMTWSPVGRITKVGVVAGVVALAKQ